MLSRAVARQSAYSLRRVSLVGITTARSLLLPRCNRFATSRVVLDKGDSNDKTHHLGSFKVDKPMLMIAFTCKKCNHRSSHSMSKQAYTSGTVLITCPSCKSKHLIADHLKIFRDEHVNIEDILKAKGESVSSTTDDLAFEDIPKSLQNVIGHHAKDAPDHLRKKLDNETVHALPNSHAQKKQ